jgi:hypothetical protein
MKIPFSKMKTVAIWRINVLICMTVIMKEWKEYNPKYLGNSINSDHLRELK